MIPANVKDLIESMVAQLPVEHRNVAREVAEANYEPNLPSYAHNMQLIKKDRGYEYSAAFTKRSTQENGEHEKTYLLCSITVAAHVVRKAVAL
jgi:hypothetical protein